MPAAWGFFFLGGKILLLQAARVTLMRRATSHGPNAPFVTPETKSESALVDNQYTVALFRNVNILSVTH